MRVLAVGDRFVPAESYLVALAARLSRAGPGGGAPDTDTDAAPGPAGGGPGGVELCAVDWAGDRAAQHAAQQAMERYGPDAVPPPAELLAAVGGAGVLCVHFAPVSGRLLAAADGLRLVAVARAAVQNVDVAAATERGVGVVPVAGRNAAAVAELQIGLMLAEARDIARADRSVRQGGWRKEYPGPRVQISGRTVGMVGFGQVGAQFAARLAGFGPCLLAYDPYAHDATLARYGVRRATLDEVFAESDFVVVQARHTARTDRFIGAAQLALMRPTAYLINVSRSRLVDTGALYDALAGGRIAGAGLDVHDEEPLPADSPWRRLDNVTITTHFGGDTEETVTTSARLVAEQVVTFLAGGRCPDAVNATALGWR